MASLDEDGSYTGYGGTCDDLEDDEFFGDEEASVSYLRGSDSREEQQLQMALEQQDSSQFVYPDDSRYSSNSNSSSNNGGSGQLFNGNEARPSAIYTGSIPVTAMTNSSGGGSVCSGGSRHSTGQGSSRERRYNRLRRSHGGRRNSENRDRGMGLKRKRSGDGLGSFSSMGSAGNLLNGAYAANQSSVKQRYVNGEIVRIIQTNRRTVGFDQNDNRYFDCNSSCDLDRSIDAVEDGYDGASEQGKCESVQDDDIGSDNDLTMEADSVITINSTNAVAGNISPYPADDFSQASDPHGRHQLKIESEERLDYRSSGRIPIQFPPRNGLMSSNSSISSISFLHSGFNASTSSSIGLDTINEMPSQSSSPKQQQQPSLPSSSSTGYYRQY